MSNHDKEPVDLLLVDMWPGYAAIEPRALRTLLEEGLSLADALRLMLEWHRDMVSLVEDLLEAVEDGRVTLDLKDGTWRMRGNPVVVRKENGRAKYPEGMLALSELIPPRLDAPWPFEHWFASRRSPKHRGA